MQAPPRPPSPYPTGNYSLGNGYFLLFGFGGYGMTCNAALQFPSGYIMRYPLLTIFSLIALYIGVRCGRAIWKSGLKNSRTYAISFFAFGTMMTLAAFADSLLPMPSPNQPNYLTIYVLLVDVWLTSCIAASFMYNGLADVGVINPLSRKSIIAQAVTYVAIFGAYYYGFFINPFPQMFTYLYTYLILVTCGIYVVCEFVYLFFQGHSKGIRFLFIGGLSGAIGLYFTMYYPPSLCNFFTPLFGNQESWFLLSDVAMFFIYKYFMENRSSDKPAEETPRTEDIESVAFLSEDSVALEPIYVQRL